MKKLLLTALILSGLAFGVKAQSGVVFSLETISGLTYEYSMDETAKIYFSDTELLFKNEDVSINLPLSEISKAYFTTYEEVGETGNQQLSIYPNPVKDVMKINNLGDNQLVTIYSLKGQTVMQFTASGEASVNVSDLHAGIYIISAGNSVSKFIKM